MKKIVGIIAAATMAASMFAVDISSTVKMSTKLAAKNGDDVDFLKLNTKDQKDNDALIISGATDKAGAQFQLWYLYDGTNGENTYIDVGGLYGDPNKAKELHGVRIRGVNAWFKPLDTMKVTVGDITVDSYKEMIFWWHGVYGEVPGSWGAFGGEYVGGNGAKVEYSPVAGLDLTAAIFPGAGNAFASTVKDSKVSPYVLKAKYSNIADLPVSAAAVFADKGDTKIIGLGADYGSPWSGAFYAFLNANINLNKGEFAAVSLDNFEKYTLDALQITGHFPVSIYKAGDDMKVGLHASVKATYALGGYTPYLLVSNEPDGDAGWADLSDVKLNLTVKPGVTFNVGSAAFDAAVRVDIADGKVSNWSVPLDITVGL